MKLSISGSDYIDVTDVSKADPQSKVSAQRMRIKTGNLLDLIGHKLIGWQGTVQIAPPFNDKLTRLLCL